jgi:mannose-1-phosphate guanylyltransferase
MNKSYYVAIMAGGIGSRFWPRSRVAFPKQFLDILGLGRTLLQMTYDRFSGFIHKDNIYIVTNADYVRIVKKQLPEVADHQILGEPVRKNTAPCTAYISNKLYALNPEAVMIVSPSDHIVLNTNAFVETCKKAMQFVENNDALITLGIVPTRPDTGYGYIQFDEETANDKIYRVKTFTEKPTLEIAKKFLKSGDFLWNSGIFIWKADTILKAFTRYQPDIADAFHAETGIYNTDREKRFIRKAYELCPNISIDYGIMEKSDNVYVIPSELGWSDLGTWQALYERYEKDYLGNAVSGKNVMIFDASNNMIMVPDEKLVVLQDLENYIVVDTGDVLLICPRNKEQDIKMITTEIKRLKGEQYL